MEHSQVPKEIVTQDGTVYTIKKPLYKQFLFWTNIVQLVIVISLIVGLSLSFLAILGLTSENESLTHKIEQRTDGLDETDDTTFNEVAIGKSVEFTGGEKITVNSIKEDKNRKLEDNSSGKAVVVNVTIENTGNKTFSVNLFDFNLSDEKENIYILDSSSYNNGDISHSLEKGKKVTMDLVYDGEKYIADKWSLTYSDTRWSEEGKDIRGTAIQY